MNFRSKFDIGEIVYLKTDVDQKKRIVSQICFGGEGKIEYNLRCGSESSWHFSNELSTEIDFKLSTSG